MLRSVAVAVLAVALAACGPASCKGGSARRPDAPPAQRDDCHYDKATNTVDCNPT